MKTSEDFMKHCLNLGMQALKNGNPPVGAIIVYCDEIIGEGIESGKSTGDITNHAEILAVRDAIAKGNIEHLPQSTLYSTHEPCIMCSYLTRHHKISNIVYSTDVRYVGGYSSNFSLLKTESVPGWGNAPTVIRGVLEKESKKLTEEFSNKIK